MMSRALLGVAIIAALLNAATATYCHHASAGYAEGTEYDREESVPANTQDYNLTIPQVCPDTLVGVIASACSEYNFTLNVVDTTQVYVHQDYNPLELDVQLQLFCQNNYVKVVAIKPNVHNSPRKKSPESQTSEDATIENKTSEHATGENETSENVTGENKTIENVRNSSRIKRSAKKHKATVEEDDNHTLEENQTAEKEAKKSLSRAQKEEKKKNKAEEKDKKSSKLNNEQGEDVNKTSENEKYDQEHEGKFKNKSSKSKKVSKDGKKKKVSKSRGSEDKEEQLFKSFKKVKVVKQKPDKGERKKRSAEKVYVELASSSSSEQVHDVTKE